MATCLLTGILRSLRSCLIAREDISKRGNSPLFFDEIAYRYFISDLFRSFVRAGTWVLFSPSALEPLSASV